jgi:hypothetical protein
MQAILRAAEEGSPFRPTLMSIVGAVFLATPFRGSAASNEAQWQVIVGGIMQEQTSAELIKGLDENDGLLRQRTEQFAELVRRDSVQLPLHCFYELKHTKLLRRFVSSRTEQIFSRISSRTQKIVCYYRPHEYHETNIHQLVAKDSACLDSFRRYGLDATHSGMNKFANPECPNFKLVNKVVKDLVDGSSSVLEKRKQCKSYGLLQWPNIR